MTMSKKNFSGVKAIEFMVDFVGDGCVNFDSGEQAWFLKEKGLLTGRVFDNCKFSKKNFKIMEGKMQFHHKVSADCLRHEMWKDSMAFMNPNIMNNPDMLYNALAHPDTILRGTLLCNAVSTLKRKSCVTITDAEEVGEWHDKVSLDFHSRSGKKESADKKAVESGDATKDTSVYSEENVGQRNYMAKCIIDVCEMPFLSADNIYDRQMIDVCGGAYEKYFLQCLKMNFADCNLDPQFGYYCLSTAITGDMYAERGILLNDECVDFLIKRAIKNVLTLHRTTAKAYLRAKNSAKLVLHTDNGIEFVDVNEYNLDDFQFIPFHAYKEADEEKVENTRKAIEEEKERLTNAKKAKKEKKSSKKQEPESE